jgi:hypothetical protein
MPAGRFFSLTVFATLAMVLSAHGQGASSVSARGAVAALKKRDDAPPSATKSVKPAPASSGKPDAPPATRALQLPRSIATTLPNFNAQSMPQFAYLRYPWKLDIVATVFWVGEQSTEKNPTPNDKSSWDTKWMKTFGGYDDPDPTKRTDFFTPESFTPKQNPFYVALPYNDVIDYNSHKPEASKIIPWFKQRFSRPGRTVLKGQWVAIRHGNRVCYAQWEDCGPFLTDDHEYVFGSARPKNTCNNGAGIDLSPSIRDYLGLKNMSCCDWRFVDVSEVPAGPWRNFGDNNHFVRQQKIDKEREHSAISSRLEELRRMRDEYFKQNGTGALR